MPTPLEWLQRLDKRLEARRPEVQKYDEYYRNEHEAAVYSTTRWRRQFGRLLANLNDNWCELVVDAPAERMKVEGFRFGSGDEGADADAWDIWQRNEMDAQHKLAIIEAGKCGESYTLVEATEDGPQITVEHPFQCIVAHDPGFRRRRTAGLKKWLDDDGYICANLYTVDTVFKFRSREKTNGGSVPTSIEWLPREDADGLSMYLHGLGGVPLIPLVNRPSMLRDGDSDIRVVIPIQDAVNNLCRGLLATADSASFKQRWATGIDIPIDEDTGAPPPTFLSGADRVWAVGDENAKFGQFDASDLSNFTKAIEMFIQHIAALTRTPPHYLLGQSGAFPSGEAMALDTPIPTPDGMVPIGALVEGDEVYDETGTVQTVLHAFDVLHDRPCYEVAFDDGTTVTADANHKWYTIPYRDRQARRPGTVTTTADMAETVMATNTRGELISTGRNRQGCANHAIPVAGPIERPEAELSIPPYALGVWLGDGTSVHAEFTQHVDDVGEIVANLENDGVRCDIRPGSKPTTVKVTLGKVNSTGMCRRGHERVPGERQCARCEHLGYRFRAYGEPVPEATNVPFRTKLIRLGVLGQKHIPEAYFLGSVKQRLALLQGIMDTDGSTTPGGSVTLDLHDERLASDVHRLIQTLGHKCALRPNIDSYGLPRWRMAWSAPDPVFRLTRKLDKQTLVDSGVSRFRFVRSVTPVESVPVRCIAVSGPSHLFLAGEACIPTHNSLKSTETGLVAKVRSKFLPFGEAFEETMRMAFRADGDQARGSEVAVETLWADPESRTTGEQTDAALKELAAGIPDEMVWARRFGMSPQEIARAKAMKLANAFAAPPALPALPGLPGEVSEQPEVPA